MPEADDRRWVIDVCPECGKWGKALSRKRHFRADPDGVVIGGRGCPGVPERIEVVPARLQGPLADLFRRAEDESAPSQYESGEG